MLFMVGLAWDMLLGRIAKARSDDRGASAVEWAIIAAVSVLIAVTVAGVIYHFVDSQGKNLTNCQSYKPGDSGC